MHGSPDQPAGEPVVIPPAFFNWDAEEDANNTLHLLNHHSVTGEAVDGPIRGDWVEVVAGLRRGERAPVKRPGGTLIYEATGELIADEPGQVAHLALKFVGETI